MCQLLMIGWLVLCVGEAGRVREEVDGGASEEARREATAAQGGSATEVYSREGGRGTKTERRGA